MRMKMRLGSSIENAGVQIVVATVAAALLAGAFFSMTWRTGDEARYFVLARSLARSGGYTQVYHPFTPPETLTPPLYPFLASLAMRLIADDVRAAKLVTALMYVLSAPMAVLLLRRLFPDRLVLVLPLTAMGLAVVGLLTMSCWCMADTTYIVFSLATLMVLYPVSRCSAQRAVLGGVLCGLAYLSRAVGLSLAAGAGIYLLLHRRWRMMFWFVAGFLLIAGWWMARSTALTGLPDPYLSYTASRVGAPSVSDYPAGLLLRQWRVGLPSYLLGVLPRQMFFNLTWGRDLLGMIGLGMLSRPVEIVTGLLVIAGWLLSLRRPGVMEFYWPIYWLMVAGQPIPPQQTYYVFPAMVPAVAYWTVAVKGMGKYFGRWAPRLASMLVVLAGLYALATASVAGMIHVAREAPRRHLAPWAPERYLTYSNIYMTAWARYVEACQWIGSNSVPDSVVACRKPQHTYVFSGRRAWRYDVPAEVGCRTPWEAVLRMSRRQNVYIVEDAFHVAGDSITYAQNYRTAMLPLLAKLEGRLSCVYVTASPQTKVWTLRR